MPKRPPLVPPAGLVASSLRVGDEELAVLAFPVPMPELPASLTQAEREVAKLVLEGCSNEQIAKVRKRSVRTIANQIARIFRRLGVGSRAELVLRLSKGAP